MTSGPEKGDNASILFHEGRRKKKKKRGLRSLEVKFLERKGGWNDGCTW